MNKDKKRILIAEACGWRIVEGLYAFPPQEIIERLKERFPNLAAVSYEVIPNFPEDLNAMAEAEKAIQSAELKDSYVRYLHCIVGSSMPFESMNLAEQFLIVNATAAQRAEAFLRTIGKWEDSQ